MRKRKKFWYYCCTTVASPLFNRLNCMPRPSFCEVLFQLVVRFTSLGNTSLREECLLSSQKKVSFQAYRVIKQLCKCFCYRVSQKKVYNKMCVLFAGFVRGFKENCMSQAGEGRDAPQTPRDWPRLFSGTPCR